MSLPPNTQHLSEVVAQHGQQMVHIEREIGEIKSEFARFEDRFDRKMAKGFEAIEKTLGEIKPRNLLDNFKEFAIIAAAAGAMGWMASSWLESKIGSTVTAIQKDIATEQRAVKSVAGRLGRVETRLRHLDEARIRNDERLKMLSDRLSWLPRVAVLESR